MNKLKIWMYAAVLTVAATSCKKSLDLAPEDYFGEGNFWQNETQVNNFMVGVHNQFRNNTFQFIRLGEMRGGGFSNIDRQNTSLNELPIIEQRIDENSAGVGSWGGFYNPILQLNLFIQKVEAIDFLTPAKKGFLLGQAYGLRAYYYFHLLRTYGGVPLQLQADVLNGITDPIALRKPRSKEADILAAVKNDIAKSLSLFGAGSSSANKNQWSVNATQMLKGEVYLWSAKVYNTTADLAEAKTALDAITGYSLQSNFASVFASNNKNNSEIIFTVKNQVGESEMPNVAAFTYSLFNFDGQHYKDSTVSAGVGNFLSDPLVIGASNSQQIIQRYGYTFELFQSYGVADKRRNATFYDYYKVNTATNPYTLVIRNTALVKFLGVIQNNKRYFSDDWPVYREADRQLMLAEIINAQGGDPTTYVKAIRDRAFGAGNDPSPFVNGSKDQNELAIFAERSKEFVYEGKRWYDIRRMTFGGQPLVFKSANQPYGVLDKATQDYKVLWPIEPAIWTNDPTVDQTPGYPTTKPK